jgi:uncharacterized membrane protein (DUF485 family)
MITAHRATPVEPGQSGAEVLASPAFRALVRARWWVSLALLTLLVVAFFGLILVAATAPELAARRLSDAPGAVVNVGLALAIGTLVLAWIITAGYVAWANGRHDPEVARLRRRLRP